MSIVCTSLTEASVFDDLYNNLSLYLKCKKIEYYCIFIIIYTI